MRHAVRSVLGAVLAVAASGCSHSEPFAYVPPATGPNPSGPPVQLTFNSDQDYWPTYTRDGRGILYAFVDPVAPRHRCLGLLPAPGGSRIWELCDNRTQRDDSLSSYIAFALDSAGRLLLAEAVSPVSFFGQPPSPIVNLWLTDTASPGVRTRLLTLPVTVGTTNVTWLADIQWLAANEFIALGQQPVIYPHCVSNTDSLNGARQCFGSDTAFAEDGVVLRGAIGATGTTLSAVAGTEGASGYSLAEGGASIVFSRKDEAQLYRVPFGGGAATSLLPAPTPTQQGRVLGVSCLGTTCIYARDSIYFVGTTTGGRTGYYFTLIGMPPATRWVNSGFMQVHRLGLESKLDQVLFDNFDHLTYASPKISPLSGDVVLQLGGGWGHVQTFATSSQPVDITVDGNSVLMLYMGLVQ